MTEDQIKNAIALGRKLARYAPHFTGRVTPAESVKDMMAVINKATLEGGYSGSFISHLGNKQWL